MGSEGASLNLLWSAAVREASAAAGWMLLRLVCAALRQSSPNTTKFNVASALESAIFSGSFLENNTYL
jgi:hypothetical protein